MRQLAYHIECKQQNQQKHGNSFLMNPNHLCLIRFLSCCSVKPVNRIVALIFQRCKLFLSQGTSKNKISCLPYSTYNVMRQKK